MTKQNNTKEKKEISTEIIHKEIDLIQSCISRMAHNSFLIKGWLISLIAIILTLFLKGEFKQPSIIILVELLGLIIVFWILDAYFLQQERIFRKFYKNVIEKRLKGDDSELYSLNIKLFLKNNNDIKESESFTQVVFSITLKFFYGMLIVLIIVTFTSIYFFKICTLVYVFLKYILNIT